MCIVQAVAFQRLISFCKGLTHKMCVTGKVQQDQFLKPLSPIKNSSWPEMSDNHVIIHLFQGAF